MRIAMNKLNILCSLNEFAIFLTFYISDTKIILMTTLRMNLSGILNIEKNHTKNEGKHLI